jgi:hypothetical protein
MSAIPAETIEHNRDDPDGRNQVCPLTNHTYDGEHLQLRHGRRHMRVKLCARCPYTPMDLIGYFDPDAAVHACAKCDGEQRAAVARHYPREAERRRNAQRSQISSEQRTEAVRGL